MNDTYANAKAGVRRMFGGRTQRQTRGIAELQTRREVLTQTLQAIEKMRDRLESPEFRWLVREYLPAEIMRIAVDSAIEIDYMAPQYERKKLVADAQIQQCKLLIDRLSDVRRQERMIRDQLLAVNREMAAVNKQN